MSTLREEAEKLVSEAFSEVQNDDATDYQAAALSAVLKGMKLVVERDAFAAHEEIKAHHGCRHVIGEAIRAQLRELGEEEKR